MTREETFFKALRDVFVGAKVEGESGFVNLMRIKARYYEKGVFPHLQEDIARALQPFPEFREELFDRLYTFFHRYFSESGSIYFRYTPLHERIYEQVYTDDRDVVLFWKTHMLHYVKTDRLFRSMAVEVDGCRFFFDVSSLEHKRANEKRELVYDFREKRRDGTLVLGVAYSEKGRKTKLEEIRKALRKEDVTVDEDLLARAFRLFERQSEVDFFINKNARAFLREQFDLWLYQYVFRGETTWTEQRIRQLQVIKEIAYKIIDFISQFEDELVRIWNKPKFVLNSGYVITLDLIADGDVGLMERLLAHTGMSDQVQEWRLLGMVGEDFKPEDVWQKDLMGVRLHSRYQYLPLDTRYFKDLELSIVGLFDHLDDALDGRLIKSENYQALNTLVGKLAHQVQTIYIDPPYNADATEILYQNEFKHSSWLTLMRDRLQRSRDFLAAGGILCATIDDNEMGRLQLLLDDVFLADNHLSTIVIRNNPSGRSTVKGFAINHEYVLIYAASARNAKIGRFPHTEEQRKRYDQVVGETGEHFEWENFRKNSTGSYRVDRPRQFYPIYYDRVARALRIPRMEWQDGEKFWTVLDEPGESEIAIWPLDHSGRERVWRWGVERAAESLDELLVRPTEERLEVYKRKYLQEQGSLPRTWWDDPAYSARDNGTRTLVNLFGSEKSFDFPKSTRAVEDTLRVCSLDDDEVALDFFAGSGTTAHAVINLNREDGDKRRYILVEMADYFDTVLLPRVKKVVFSDRWKDGKAENGQGISHFVKYYQLEQYEDVLRRARYEDADLFENPYQDPYTSYVFLRDRKMLDNAQTGQPVVEIDTEKETVRVDLSRLYEGIDLAETLSCITGKHVRRIHPRQDDPTRPGEVEFEDGERVSLVNPPWDLIKPLVWW